MKIDGDRLLPFPRADVWDALMDPEVLSRTLPGCEELTRRDDETLEGRLQVAVGPVRGQFRGTLTTTELDPPRGYHMRLHGQGPSGFLEGEGTVSLSEEEGGTRLAYDLDAQVGGRIAGVGQRLLDSSARAIAAQGLDGLERQLAARRPASGTENSSSESPPPSEAPAAPSQAEFAAAVAKEVAGDLVPPWARYALVAVFAFVAGLLVGLAL